MNRVALTRSVSDAIARCELTHLERTPIDPARARVQHAVYERALEAAGCTVQRVPDAPDSPDGVFVEDTAVVVGELAVITRPGAASRRTEVDSVARALAAGHELVRIRAPGTLEGGDVLRIADTLYVGRSARTNAEGIAQLRAAVASRGLEVVEVDLKDALHLKTAVTAIAADTVLLQPRWVDPGVFSGYRALEVHPDEPFAANTVLVDRDLIMAAAHPRTAEICASFVDRIHPVPADELARAEGGVSCCSILLELEW